MRDEQRYEGWTNWQSWYLFTWLTSYDELRERAREEAEAGEDSVREYVVRMLLDETPEGPKAAPLTDFLLRELLAVDWGRLAEALVES